MDPAACGLIASPRRGPLLTFGGKVNPFRGEEVSNLLLSPYSVSFLYNNVFFLHITANFHIFNTIFMQLSDIGGVLRLCWVEKRPCSIFYTSSPKFYLSNKNPTLILPVRITTIPPGCESILFCRGVNLLLSANLFSDTAGAGKESGILSSGFP